MTPELANMRRGKMTASMAAVIMGKLTTEGLSEYTRVLAGERVYGDLGEDGYQSWSMKRGQEQEAAALDWFEFVENVTVLRQQHIDHPTIPNVAATPDGLVAGEYTVEAKCPLFHVWCETREAWQNGKRGMDAIPSTYRHQCRWQPWCCGLTRGKFVAFHPAGGGQGIVVPYEITADDIKAMTARVVIVEALVRNWVNILKG